MGQGVDRHRGIKVETIMSCFVRVLSVCNSSHLAGQRALFLSVHDK
jgi:hypothetical protein